MDKRIVCDSVEETEAAGYELAVYAKENGFNFVALYGDLGVGKTAFVRGFTAFHDKGACVTSPTYNLVNVYGNVYHFDMYRINDEDDLYSIGFYDYDDGENVILTEWSENIEFALPKKYIKVTISKTYISDDMREIHIETVVV